MRRVALLLTAVTLIAGTTPIAAQMATRELPPLTIPVVRFGVAGALLAVTVRLLDLWRPISARYFPLLIGLAFLCVPVNQLGYLVGIKKANASHAGIAYALVPVLVFWFSVGMRRTKATLRLGTASLLAFAGAALVVLATSQPVEKAAGLETDFLLGDVLLLSAAASWSLFVVLSQPLVKELGAVLTLSVVFLIGTAWQLPVAAADWLWFDLAAFDFGRVSWQGWFGLAYITLITAFVNYLLWYVVTARYDVTRSSVVTNAHFIVTVALESLLYGRSVTAWALLGSALLLSGIVLATRTPETKKEGTKPQRGALD